MKKRRHWLATPALFVLVTIVGAALTLGSGSFHWGKSQVLPDVSSSAAHPPGAVAVTLEPVRLRPIERTVVTLGTLHPFEEVVISAKVEGRVRRIMHDVGDRVGPGDLLLEIDPTDYDLSVRQAVSALDVELAKLGLTQPPRADFDVTHLPAVIEASVKMTRAKDRLERARTLVERSAMSRDDLGGLQSEFQSLQSERDNQILLAKSGLATIQMKREALAIVRQQLKETRIEASHPLTLVPRVAGAVTYGVTSRSTAEGSFLRAGTEVFKLVIDRPLKLKVPMPDSHVAHIQIGQKARIATAAYDREFEGAVARINPAVDPVTRTFEVEIQVPNTDGALKSGSFAKAAIVTGFDEQTQTVPLQAIVRFAGIVKLFLAEDGHARELHVAPGAVIDRSVEIVNPKLPADAQVVTSGQAVLSDGAAIYVR